MKPIYHDEICEVTQEKDENIASFLSWVTEAFRKDTDIHPESTEGRTLLAMHFITQVTPDIWRKFKKLEAGPQIPQSTLVEEAFKVSNNQDLMAETNENRRLVKRMQLLAVLIHVLP